MIRKAILISVVILFLTGCKCNQGCYAPLHNITGKPDIDWVYVNVPSIDGKEGFVGYFSKHQTTNAQYALFLNQSMANSYIHIADGWVKEANTGYNYYRLVGDGLITNGIKGEGVSRIRFYKGSFVVDDGFEDDAATYVTWFGAAAFCDYYGWRLPNEWQWQAVAEFNETHHGKLENMFGDIMEFTASSPHPPIHSYHVLKGGKLNTNNQQIPDVSIRFYPSFISRYDIGFRACR